MVDEIMFGRWVSDNRAPLFRAARRLVGDIHLAEDLVQETFRSAWKGRGHFDEDREDRSWLFTILRRRVADHWRSRKSEDCSEFLETAVEDADPFLAELPRRMTSALNSLPEGMKDAFLLIAVDELTHREASERLGVPIGTVLSRFSRARIKMRRALSDA